MNKYSECPDDCGAWQQGKNSTKTNVFIKSGETLHFVVTSVVTVKRKYLVLDRNSNYKKRITWFDCEPEITTTVVEYIVEYTTSGAHGNAKTTTAPYKQQNISTTKYN
jgi:hypothetical protein